MLNKIYSILVEAFQHIWSIFMEFWFYNILIVFLIGIIVGISELLNRYPEPTYIFNRKTIQSYIYILLNGCVAIGAFLLIKYFKNEEIAMINKIEINNIIIAGLGGMMILRSSLFTLKHKDENISVGFGAIAQIFLDAIENKMKTNVATLRMEKLKTLMTNIDFDKAKLELSTLCISYIDNFSKENTEALTKAIEEIATLDIDNKNKSLQLGRYISRYCDFDLLEKAINCLGDVITTNSGTIENQDVILKWEQVVQKWEDLK